MVALLVRNLDKALVERLKARAAQNGRSTEAEHRAILEAELPVMDKAEWLAKAADLRRRIGAKPGSTMVDLLRESRDER